MTQKYWRSAMVAVLMGGLLAACSGDNGGNSGSAGGQDEVTWIEGTVMYREKMRLPPTAEVEIELQDISRADAPADTLATVIIPGRAGPPYSFRIEYDTAAIDSRHRYALRATILADGKLLFSSTEHIDPFADTPIEIMVSRVPERVSAPSRPEPAAVITALEGRWLLVSLDGEKVGAGAGGRALDLLLESEDKTASGFSGCNRFKGSYRREGSSEYGAALRFSQLAGTLMMCQEGTGLERRYLDALGAVDNFRFSEDGRLQLAAGANLVAEYEPAP